MAAGEPAFLSSDVPSDRSLKSTLDDEYHMNADAMLIETRKRMRDDDARTPAEAMYAFVAMEVCEYDGVVVTPDYAFVDRWLRNIVYGRPADEAAEMDADLVECLARFLA